MAGMNVLDFAKRLFPETTGTKIPKWIVVFSFIAYICDHILCTDPSDGGYAVKGFALHRERHLPNNMVSLQCNGSGLPSGVGSVVAISIERQPTDPGAQAYVLAYLTQADGVRLQHTESVETLYVSGEFHTDDMASTSLTVLLEIQDFHSLNVTYGCSITCMEKGKPKIIHRKLHITHEDIQRLRQHQKELQPSTVGAQLDSDEGRHGKSILSGSAQSRDTNNAREDPDMPVVLVTLAVLLLVLFIVCLVLVIDRRRGINRNKRKMTHANSRYSNRTQGEGGHTTLPSQPPGTYKHGDLQHQYSLCYDDSTYSPGTSIRYSLPADDISRRGTISRNSGNTRGTMPRHTDKTRGTMPRNVDKTRETIPRTDKRKTVG